ncbi:hypothetical protein TNCT_36091 [Trichonephila clavata]|uniref:Uncharacterized protein n=1 Tax=Trichonephila clavata TaxID=2740835 RepID=A0A8X6I0M1_TRICU|nr:hypothetical protein TNCT_36091 [Trichonephila clavata]
MRGVRYAPSTAVQFCISLVVVQFYFWILLLATQFCGTVLAWSAGPLTTQFLWAIVVQFCWAIVGLFCWAMWPDSAGLCCTILLGYVGLILLGYVVQGLLGYVIFILLGYVILVLLGYVVQFCWIYCTVLLVCWPGPAGLLLYSSAGYCWPDSAGLLFFTFTFIVMRSVQA